MVTLDNGLIERVVRGISRPGGASPGNVTGSILAQAASSYGSRPIIDESTVPTGFDPVAAALFEATVEAAYLVVNADGHIDRDERVAFQTVVTEACNNLVQRTQLEALLNDLAEQLAEDGIEKRARAVARTIVRRDHQIEILRIAALMAHVSGGVSDAERAVLDQLAREFDLDNSLVDAALDEAAAALGVS